MSRSRTVAFRSWVRWVSSCAAMRSTSAGAARVRPAVRLRPLVFTSPLSPSCYFSSFASSIGAWGAQCMQVLLVGRWPPGPASRSRRGPLLARAAAVAGVSPCGHAAPVLFSFHGALSLVSDSRPVHSRLDSTLYFYRVAAFHPAPRSSRLLPRPFLLSALCLSLLGHSGCRPFLFQLMLHECARRWNSPWRRAHAGIGTDSTLVWPSPSPRPPPFSITRYLPIRLTAGCHVEVCPAFPSQRRSGAMSFGSIAYGPEES